MLLASSTLSSSDLDLVTDTLPKVEISDLELQGSLEWITRRVKVKKPTLDTVKIIGICANVAAAVHCT
jgi:hypothetical protein